MTSSMVWPVWNYPAFTRWIPSGNRGAELTKTAKIELNTMNIKNMFFLFIFQIEILIFGL
jgi:hypothetical protein